MLKGLTTTFKNKCNATEVVLSEYLVLGNQTIPIKAKLDDDSYENGNFVGTFILKKIEFETDATYDFKDKEFEYYKKIDNESIKIGTFITTEVTINDSQDLVKVVGMDYGLKTQVEYTSSLDYASGTITLKDVWDEACTLSGLESGINDFANSDFIVDSDQFTGTGATIRDVFKGIAMSSGTFVKVMNDDKIYLIFNELTSELKNLEINGSATIQDGYKLNSLELQGNTTQDGTPTPSSPVDIDVVTGRQNVEVVGKNLFNDYRITPRTLAGVTYSGVDGGTKLDGTYDRSVSADFWLTESMKNSYNNLILLKANTTYTIKVSVVSGTFTSNYGISCALSSRTADENKTFSYNYQILTQDGTTWEKTFTVGDSDIYGAGVRFTLTTNRITTFNNTVFHVQIEKSSTASEYEAYKGQNYEVNLGKNLLKFDLATAKLYNTQGTWNDNDIYSFYGIDAIVNNDNTITIGSGTATAGYNFYLYRNETGKRLSLPAGTYTFSTNTSPASGNGNLAIRFRDNNGNTISGVSDLRWSGGTSTSATKTINQDFQVAIYIQISNDATETEKTYQIQIEKGSTASLYSPYFTPIELCKIGDYKDRIYKSNGKWYIEKKIGKVVLVGSDDEGWQMISSQELTNTIYLSSFAIDGLMKENTLTFSNYFTKQSGLWNNDVEGYQLTTQDRNIRLRINKSTASYVSAFKTWLSTHNTTVYYVLATPTITEITNTELISQLESIELFKGLNNITISSNDLPSPLKITYYNNELDIIEDYTDLEDKRDTHPWTCLRLGMSQIDGENVDYIDEELVEQYGENWLILNDNPFAYNQTKRQQLIMNIFNQIKEFGYSSFSSKTSFKPYLTCGDLIKFKNRDGNLVNSIVLRYDHDYENITIEAPSETSATVNYIYPLSAIDVAKRAQIEVDKEQGQITSLVETTTNLNTRTTKNETDINNNYQEIIGKFNDVASVDDVTQLRQAMQTTMTEQELRIENIQSALDGGVEKVTTTSGTFDENGLTMEKTGAKTKGVFDESGLDIQDAQGSSNQDLLFAGYVDSDKAQSNQDLTPYEGQTVVYTKNIIVKNYLTIGTHSRIEDFEDGTGVFYIGG